MHLTPTELERLTIFTAAELARRYLSAGVRLSYPEAVAYLADALLLAARQGMDHPALVAHAGSLLTHEQVEPGVPSLLTTFSVEVMMDEGTKLVTIFDPIPPGPEEFTPGQIIAKDGEIELNAGRDAVEIEVLNTGDRSIQVRSHAHFFEVNRALSFDRRAAFGRRLDRPSGGGERFDPGVSKRVRLISYGGRQVVHGFAGLTEGPVATRREAAEAEAIRRGYME